MTDEPEHFDALAWIAAQEWTFAKTVPEHPHWYCVHPRGPDAGWASMMRLIAREGQRGEFDGRRWKYLHLESHDYWTSRLHGRLMINRRAHVPDEGRLPGVEP